MHENPIISHLLEVTEYRKPNQYQTEMRAFTVRSSQTTRAWTRKMNKNLHMYVAILAQSDSKHKSFVRHTRENSQTVAQMKNYRKQSELPCIFV